ncbi:MAG: hypothetical protein IJU91_00930 [Selenomonadaceae bacterium]|nr:hypothetical protein [Selenomonadaceae bacterium]
MKIEITLDHTDLIGTSADNFCALMYVLQGIAKANPLLSGIKPFTEPMPHYEEQKAVHKVPEKESVKITPVIKEKPEKESTEPVKKEESVKSGDFDRKATITEVKKIVANTDKSANVRAYIDSHFGVKKLDMLTDEQLADVLRMVKQE